jgi:hypothetical protein
VWCKATNSQNIGRVKNPNGHGFVPVASYLFVPIPAGTGRFLARPWKRSESSSKPFGTDDPRRLANSYSNDLGAADPTVLFDGMKATRGRNILVFVAVLTLQNHERNLHRDSAGGIRHRSFGLDNVGKSIRKHPVVKSVVK